MACMWCTDTCNYPVHHYYVWLKWLWFNRMSHDQAVPMCETGGCFVHIFSTTLHTHNRKVKKTPLSVVQGGSNMDLRGYPPNLLVSTGDCLETTCRMAFWVMWSILDIQLTTLDWRCNHSGLLQKYGDCWGLLWHTLWHTVDYCRPMKHPQWSTAGNGMPLVTTGDQLSIHSGLL